MEPQSKKNIYEKRTRKKERWRERERERERSRKREGKTETHREANERYMILLRQCDYVDRQT